MQLPIYYQQLWAFFLGMLNYFSANVNASNPFSSYGMFSSVFQTCRSMKKLISLYGVSWFLSSETELLNEILLLPLSLDSTDRTYVTNRVNALTAFYQAVSLGIPAVPAQNYSTMNAGTDFMPSAKDLTTLVMTVQYETPPANLTASTLSTFLQEEVTAWTNLKNALLSQGISYTGSQLNAIDRQIAVSTLVMNNASTLTFSSNWSASQLWNWTAFYPTALNLVSLLSTNLAQALIQNMLVVRYTVNVTMLQFASFLLTARSQPINQVQLGTLLQNQSLMDFSSKNLGDYTQWTEVIDVNNLQPPFVSSTPVVNEASPGQQLFLPTGQQNYSILPQQISYTLNFLGTDIYYGPSQSDLVWLGDFQIITGYPNLQHALLRRLKTPIGSLIYHINYGSRIPDEIGNVTSINTSGHLNDYAESAVLADPRVQSLTDSVALYKEDQTVQLRLTVQPQGNGQSINLNEVIQPI